jgi:hypothetical protein
MKASPLPLPIESCSSFHNVALTFHHCLEADLATSAGSSFFPAPTFVSSISARAKNSVSVAPVILEDKSLLPEVRSGIDNR